ncbi:MAG: DUF2946 family protein [Aliidongia sp.]
MLSGWRAKGKGGRAAWLRAGAVLALLALFSQMAIALLPMPALAADGTPICALDGSIQQGGPNSGDTHSNHAPDCPVCQAAQLLGGLVPPDPIALPVVFGRIELADFPPVAGVRPHRAVPRHQARAPPPEV